MKHFSSVFMVALALMALFSTAVQASSGGDAVQYQQDQLSVSFRDTPIRTVLEQVAAKVGVQFLLDPEIQTTVSVKFSGLPLETALRRLLSSQSHALVHSPDKKGAFHISQVKVFKKGNLSASRFELIGPGGGKTVSASKSGGSQSAQPGTTTGKKTDVGQEQAQGQTNSRINVHSVRGPAQLMEAIAETQENIAMLERKAAGERHALEYEMARARARLASGQGDGRENMSELDTLEKQKARSVSNNQIPLNDERKKMQDLLEELAGFETPAEKLKKAQIIAIKQAAVMSDQVPEVEKKRRLQAAIDEQKISEEKRKQAQKIDEKYQQPRRP